MKRTFASLAKPTAATAWSSDFLGIAAAILPHRIPRRLLVLLWTVFTCVAVQASNTEGVEIRTDLAFLGPDRAETLDLYLPAIRAPGRPLPALVWIHGGGFVEGSKREDRARQICSTLAANGFIAASIDYHLGEGAWPQALFDSKNAVRHLRKNAAVYGVDPQRIAVGGGSAGGFLALMVGNTASDTALEPNAPYPRISNAVSAVLTMYGPTVIGVRDEPGATANGEQPRLRPVTVESFLSRASPPVLILHGTDDAVAHPRTAESLAVALKNNQVEHEFVLVEGVGHSFDWQSWEGRALPVNVEAIALAFLRKHLCSSPEEKKAAPH